MKYFLVFFIFLFCVNVVLASDISQFVFTTNSQTIKPNEVSETLTIQAQDSSGNSVKIPETIYLELETSSNTGEFSSNNTNWKPVSKLTMNKGWANRNFYYKDSIVGNYKIIVKADQWKAEQYIIVSESASTSDVDVPAQQQSTTVVDWPTEPQIYANAGEDKTAIAGADIKFSGWALGLQKEPLENARYLWSFGDGSSKEGQNVLHTYHYLGEYIVVLNVSSGKYSASDRLLVKVLPNQLTITEANKDYIKLHNGSKSDLDISYWFLRIANPPEADKLFKFPESTLIKAGTNLMISSLISGLIVDIQKADLLYPNASIACSYFPTPNIEPPVSNIAVVEPKPTTVVDSSTDVDVGNLVSDSQVANIVVTAKNDSWSLKKWLAIILGIGIIAGTGLLIIRRQSSV